MNPTFLSAASDGAGTSWILLVPKNGLNAIGESIGAWIDSLEVGNGWLAVELLGGISVGRLLLSATALLGLWIIVSFLLRWVVRRTGTIANDTPRSWPHTLIAAIRQPVAMLLLVFGIYLALVPSLSGIRREDTREAVFLMFSWMADLAAVVMWFWLVVRLVRGVEKKMNAWAESMPGTWRSLLVELSGGVLRVSAPLFAAILMLPLLQLPATIEMVAQKVIAITLILGVAGLIIRAVSVFQRVVLAQNRMDIADNLQARKISTQVRVVGRIIIWVVSILALGSTLMVFDSVRQLGTSILASAGIAGIILGLAAQRTLGNLIAGIQIAISQPIRFDDVLVVEGQFGRVEEINLTYVCLKLWDLRRMIVPITYFVERPFENWTRTGSKVLGAAMIYTDYHVPVEALRSELRRIVETCREWDRDVCGLQVTDCRESCVEIRCLVSAANASDAFDLRCIIRERMLAFVSENYPAALPRTRATLDQFPCPDVTASEVSDPDSGDSRRS